MHANTTFLHTKPSCLAWDSLYTMQGLRANMCTYMGSFYIGTWHRLPSVPYKPPSHGMDFGIYR